MPRATGGPSRPTSRLPGRLPDRHRRRSRAPVVDGPGPPWAELLLVITRRTVLLALGAGFVAIPGPASAQPPAKARRIGFLGARSRSTPASPDGAYDAFTQGLRELGSVEG